MKKRTICLLTTLTMCMGTLPVTAYAENGLDVQRDGTIEIEGGKIEATGADGGAGISGQDGSFEMEGGKIEATGGGADFGGQIELSGDELDLMEVESNPVERTEIELADAKIEPVESDPFVDIGAAEHIDSEGVQTEVIPSSDRRRVHLDGKSSDNDFSSIIRDDRTYLLIRFITDELGADVTWDAEEQSATIEKGDLEIVIFIGQSYALVNGEKVVLDAPAFVKNGNAYLPLRFVAENLGAEVIWNGADRTVTIHYDE